MSKRRRGAEAGSSSLPESTRRGLALLVAGRRAEVGEMLDADGEETAGLCDRLAGVMRVNSLSVEAMLGRFFSREMLSEHALALGKSGKGNEATLAGRIANAWARGQFPPADGPTGDTCAKAEAGEAGDDASGSKRAKPQAAEEE